MFKFICIRIFKAIADREGNFATPINASRDVISQSTAQPPIEVAKFSALVTRPPKLVKSVKKETPVSKPCGESSSESPSTSNALAAPRTPSPSPKVRREKPQKPPRITKEKDKEKEKKKAEKLGDVAVITETVGSYYVSNWIASRTLLIRSEKVLNFFCFVFLP